MVQLPGAHSHVVAIFGNQTYLTALAQSYHSVHAVHSFRGTFTATRGHGDHESTRVFEIRCILLLSESDMERIWLGLQGPVLKWSFNERVT